MKVFVSWSGEPSKSVAGLLRNYLPLMINDLKVFVSKHDLESGDRWTIALALELAESSTGIICLTATNQTAPWLVFEAGALTKLVDGRATGLLLDGLTAANVGGPLAQFQHQQMDQEGFSQLMRDLNRRRPEPLADSQIDLIVQQWWSRIWEEYQAILKKRASVKPEKEERSQREILEEILVRVRSIGRPAPGNPSEHRMADDIFLEGLLTQTTDEEMIVLSRIARMSENERLEWSQALERDNAEVLGGLVNRGIVKRDEDGGLRVGAYTRRVLLARLQSLKALGVL